MVYTGASWAKSIDDGMGMLGLLYDFTRKPGVRAELASYLQDYIEGWVDVPGRATLDQNVSPVHVSADAFWDDGRELNNS